MDLTYKIVFPITLFITYNILDFWHTLLFLNPPQTIPMINAQNQPNNVDIQAYKIAIENAFMYLRFPPYETEPWNMYYTSLAKKVKQLPYTSIVYQLFQPLLPFDLQAKTNTVEAFTSKPEAIVLLYCMKIVVVVVLILLIFLVLYPSAPLHKSFVESSYFSPFITSCIIVIVIALSKFGANFVYKFHLFAYSWVVKKLFFTVPKESSKDTAAKAIENKKYNTFIDRFILFKNTETELFALDEFKYDFHNNPATSTLFFLMREPRGTTLLINIFIILFIVGGGYAIGIELCPENEHEDKDYKRYLKVTFIVIIYTIIYSVILIFIRQLFRHIWHKWAIGKGNGTDPWNTWKFWVTHEVLTSNHSFLYPKKAYDVMTTEADKFFRIMREYCLQAVLYAIIIPIVALIFVMMYRFLTKSANLDTKNEVEDNPDSTSNIEMMKTASIVTAILALFSYIYLSFTSSKV